MDWNPLQAIRQRMCFSQLGKPATVGFAVVIVLVTVVAAGRLIGAVTAKEFQVVPASSASSAVAEESSREPVSLFVHISGCVRNPGLVELPEGARVADAIQAAGGFTDNALVDSVNLARVLTDGEQVVVAAVQPAPASDEEAESASVASIGATQSVSPADRNPSQLSLVNINTANESELETLPGIGPSTAAKVVADRKANGFYKTIEDLKRVSGIGDKKFEAIRGLICV